MDRDLRVGTSDLCLRTIAPDEVPTWVASASVPFFETDIQGALAHWTPHLEPARTWLVTDGGRAVGTCCVFSRDVTLPSAVSPDLAFAAACPVVKMTAVSGVGVHPSHRRRGLLTSMMRAMLHDGVERGEPLAGLLASEAGIYGRFGFGLATFDAQLVLDPRRCQFARPASGTVQMVTTPEARDALPGLHERARRRRPGGVNRNEAAWADEWADNPARRDGATAAFRAVTDGGFVSYRVKHHSLDDIQANQVVVYDLFGASAADEAALWCFVLELDLVGEVVVRRRPADDPLRWWLTDPRQVRTRSLSDLLWVRPLDVPAALSARGYGQPGRLVLEVVAAPSLGGTDPAAGRFVLDAGPDGASCQAARPGQAADVVLGVAALGSLLMGGVSAVALAAAGLIVASEPRLVELVDAMFRSSVAPFAGTRF